MLSLSLLNNTPHLHKFLDKFGMTANCPLCNTNSIDSWYHRCATCPHPKMVKARHDTHDANVMTTLTQLKTGNKGRTLIHADIKGMRANDPITARRFDFHNEQGDPDQEKTYWD